MSVPDKLAEQAAQKLGEAVLAAAMVVPPGATLYRSYTPKSKTLAIGGPIAAALASKADGAVAGQAGAVPTAQGVLALTATRAVYFKKKAMGTGVGDQLVEWPRHDLVFTYEDNGKWAYPGLLITFPDGSNCVVFGEKRWGLDRIAASEAG